MGKLAYATECQEGAEAQRGSRVGILQRIAYEDTVLIVLEHHFLLQYYATHAINRGRHYVTAKLADVLMTLRAIIIALILVESEVELCTVLNDRTVE